MTKADDLVAIALDRCRLGIDDNRDPFAVPDDLAEWIREQRDEGRNG